MVCRASFKFTCLVRQLTEAPLGTCCLTVELAGPSAPSVIPLTGADGYSINQAAAWIAAHCVLASNGIGGFVTMGTLRLQAYAMNSQADYWHTPFRKPTVFVQTFLSEHSLIKHSCDYLFHDSHSQRTTGTKAARRL